MSEPVTSDMLGREVALLVDRFRHLSEAKLNRPLPPYPTRAEAGRQVAQLLADTALGIEQRAAPAPPCWRQVPALPFAVGDQIAVTGHDLLVALPGTAAAELAWTRAGRRTTGQVVAAALDALRGLRLRV